MQNLRGINSKLISSFKESKLCQLIKENPDRLLACIRNNAIGIYYNADRIAMVSLAKDGNLKCEINSYYLSDFYLRENKDTREAGIDETHVPADIVTSFEKIKKNSDLRSTPEKKAQQALVSATNANKDSAWVCIDIEYRQSTKAQSTLVEANRFTGRFDIIAISKKKPYRIAIIELKYNDAAIGGKSGVVKHLKDFSKFNNNTCIENLKKEIKMQLSNLSELEILKDIPSIDDINQDFAAEVEFYMIFLYDTELSPRGKVGGCLFKEKHPEWGTKRVSKYNAEIEFPEGSYIIQKVAFLFKRVPSELKTGINDILEINNYEK